MLKHLLRSGGSSINGDQWIAAFGGSGDTTGKSVALAPDGSVYVCGNSSYGSFNDGPDLLLAKFSSSGTVQWQKTLSGSGYYDYGCSVDVAPDGSVYVCGYSRDNDDSIDDLLLAKFSSSGTMQWQKTLSGSNNEIRGLSVAVAPDGSVYVSGYTENNPSSANTYPDFLLVKFSSSGAVQWQKTLSGTNTGYITDEGYSVAVAPDGSVYVSGITQAADGFYHLLLAKFNSSGTVQWQKTLGYSRYYNYGKSVAVAPDGSVYVCGYSNDVDAGRYGSYSLLLAKFSSSGTMQWQKTLSGGRGGYGYSVAVAPDGSVYVCGNAYMTDQSIPYLLLAKITDSLVEKYKVTIGDFIFQDVSLTLRNGSLTCASSSLPVSNTGLTVRTSSLTVGTPSLTTNLYTYEE